jgi:predicted Ser/Thr protein kinase
MVLTQAVYDAADGCLTPPLVFRRLEDLLRDRSLYEFLNIEPDRGYHDAAAFLETVTTEYAEHLVSEIQDAMELATEVEYDRRFDEYFLHAVAAVRREKVRNPQTGEAEPPSEKLLKAVEALFGFRGPAEEFRKDLVARVGAYAVDHPRERPNFRELFPDLLRAVKRDYYARRRNLVETLLQTLPLLGVPEAPPLPAETETLARRTLGNLTARHGYCERCARAAADWLRRRGLPEEPAVTSR